MKATCRGTLVKVWPVETVKTRFVQKILVMEEKQGPNGKEKPILVNRWEDNIEVFENLPVEELLDEKVIVDMYLNGYDYEGKNGTGTQYGFKASLINIKLIA